MLRDERLELDRVAQATEQDNLRVLTTGPLPPNPAELLGSQRMRTALERLKSEGRPNRVRQPATSSGHGLRDPEFVTDVTGLRDRCSAKPEAHRSTGGRGAGTSRRKVVGAVLNRIPERADEGYAPYYGASYGSEKVAEKQAAGSSTPTLR